MPNLALIIGIPILAGWATSAWSAQQIDGSSRANFERSVALLQKELTPERREELEIALGVIWIKKTAAQNPDLDHDGSVDVDDIGALTTIAAELLTEIHRGDLLAALEKREGRYGAYAVADYIDELNGLGYDEVLALAMRPVAGGPQPAQGFAGIWYGILPAAHRHDSRVVGRMNQSLPLVLDVTTAADGTYSGKVSSVRQGTVTPLTDIVVDGTSVRWRQPAVMGSYEGEITAESRTLHGTWKQTIQGQFRPNDQTFTVVPLVFHKLQLL